MKKILLLTLFAFGFIYADCSDRDEFDENGIEFYDEVVIVNFSDDGVCTSNCWSEHNFFLTENNNYIFSNYIDLDTDFICTRKIVILNESNLIEIYSPEYNYNIPECGDNIKVYYYDKYY